MMPASSGLVALLRGALPRRMLGSHVANHDGLTTTLTHARLLRSKPLLRRFYRQSYQFFIEAYESAPAGLCLEIGSGGGFFKELLPQAITSDVLNFAGNDLATNAEALPFARRSLAAIFMLNALHHIPNVDCFFAEACRCLMPGGIIAMVEPANTTASRFIYRRFHHEPFLPDAVDWSFQPGPPLLAANGALPWIVFCRDGSDFQRRYPQLEVHRIECRSPLLYLVSGGFSLPSLLPGLAAPAIDLAEMLLAPASSVLGLFMRVVVVRR